MRSLRQEFVFKGCMVVSALELGQLEREWGVTGGVADCVSSWHWKGTPAVKVVCLYC